MASQFYLEIITPERTFYKGEVESIIIPSVGGQMGILKGNIPLMTALQSGKIKIKKDGKWYYAANSDGFAEVAQDKVVVFCQTVFWPGMRMLHRNFRTWLQASDVSGCSRLQVRLSSVRARTLRCQPEILRLHSARLRF